MKYGLALLFITRGLFGAGDDFLHLTLKQATTIANAERVSGQVGGSLDLRVIATDRSYNYKLRATWMTPDVIRAVARIQQITRGLSEEETRRLVADAEIPGNTIVMIELHGREGSGVIPSNWVATLGAQTAASEPSPNVVGRNTPGLRDRPALCGAERRDYAYDVFWMVFPLQSDNGVPIFRPEDQNAELTVRIYEKVGHVHWKIPASLVKAIQP